MGWERRLKPYSRWVAAKMANKTGQKYSETITFIRKRLRFDLLKTTVIALWCYRGKPWPSSSTKSSELDLNIEPIPFIIYYLFAHKRGTLLREFSQNFGQHLHWKKLKYLHKYCLNGTQYFPLALVGYVLC